MTTIARRIIAEPKRSASETWRFIVELLAPDTDSQDGDELLSIVGIASSLIASEVVRNAPIVVYGSGPRVRIYCLFGEDAIVGEDANETQLPFKPISGNWAMSLPCPSEELEWVQTALKKHSTHITARDMNSPIDDEITDANVKSAKINREAYFRS